MKRLTMMGMAVLWGWMAAQAQRDSIYQEMNEIKSSMVCSSMRSGICP